MGKLKDENIPDDSEIFEALIREALDNRTNVFPDDPSEFDVHVDENYVFYMFIKGEWVNVGIDISVMDNKE